MNEKILDVFQIQQQLQERQIDGWLLYDFRRSNPLAHQILKISSTCKMTRRFFYWIGKKGDPIKIVSVIEPYVLDHLPGQKWIYANWQQLEELLDELLKDMTNVAMEYSPYNALPVISKVDAGTVDSIRRRGVEVVSSADLLQTYTSVWTSEQLESHRFAAAVLEHIVEETWDFIAVSVEKGLSFNEWDVQQLMLSKILQSGCKTADAPVCASNAHSADPHYAPQKDGSSKIIKGDFILLDIWCKRDKEHAVYADITRVGLLASSATPLQQKIFDTVKFSQEKAVLLIRERILNGLPVFGWEVDEVCRQVIHEAGYGDYFIHRTGHNLGEDVHGPGANLDYYETCDFRQLLPGTAFTIEPGIYLPEKFGVRLEFDVYITHDGQVEIYGGVQTGIKLLQRV